MRMIKLMSSAVILSAVVIGCEKSETTPAVPATPAKPATPPMPATPQADSSATPAAPAAPAAPATPAVPAIPAPADVAAAAAPAATQAAAGATSAVEAEAQKLLDQATAYIKENKLDLADKTLTQLEGMKAQLSPTLAKGVDNARSLLNTAKAGGGLKLPSLGGEAK